MTKLRAVPSWALVCFALLCFSAPVFAASAVLGLDIGTEYIKAALVKPGIPLEIVLTKDSRRKEAATLAFKPSPQDSGASQSYPERLYGADAIALAARFPSEVFPNLKALLGSISDTALNAESYTERYPSLEVVKTKTGLSLKSSHFEKNEDAFTVEELLAMEIRSMKVNAENMAGKGHIIQDAVITVPAFYTVDERRAVQQAAELAGLKVMSFVTDGLAVGLNYATSRTFPNVDEGEKPEYHLIYDMGAGSTTATILQFQARNLKGFGKTNKTAQEVTVVSTGWDRTLGGDALNQLIVDDMIEKFVESSAAKTAGIAATDVKKHGRAMAKVWREASRMRVVLSANQATSASFEGLYEDVDFKYKLSRSEFEDMSSSFVQRLTMPINVALLKGRVSMNDINSVVLHGGAVRTPFVQKSLESAAGDAAKLRSNVNADEAAVFGAAFKAASLSPSFRVKQIKAEDIANYAASIAWTTDGKTRKQNIFLPSSAAGTVKSLPINHQQDFELSIAQMVDDEERFVTDFKVANLTASISELTKTYGCTKENIKGQLSVRLDPVTGLPDVSGGSVTCEYDPANKKESVVDGVKNLFGWGSKGEDAEIPMGENDTAGDETSTEPTASPTSSGSSSTKKSKSATPSSAPKKKTATVPLKLQPKRTDSKLLPDEALLKIRQRLAAFDSSDEQRILRDETFNILEALTYRVRDMLTETSIVDVSSQDQRDAVEKLLATTSDWIYGDGASAALSAIKEKLEGLQDLVNPIKLRRDENSSRPAAVKALEQALNSTSGVRKVMQGSIDRAAEASASVASVLEAAASSASAAVKEKPSASEDDLEDEVESSPPPAPTWEASPFTKWDLESIENLYNTTKEWLAEQLEAQSQLSPSDAPVLLTAELERRAQQLTDTMTRMLQRRPRTPPKPKTSKSKSKTKTKSAATSETPVVTESIETSTAADATETAQPPTGPHDEL